MRTTALQSTAGLPPVPPPVPTVEMLLPTTETLPNVATPRASVGIESGDVTTAKRGRIMSGLEKNDENSEVDGGADTSAQILPCNGSPLLSRTCWGERAGD